MLIDWLTLRCPERLLPPEFREVLAGCLGHITKFSSTGELVYSKKFLDFEHIRSDDDGLFITRQGDGNDYYFVIGASPASLEHSSNVFGSMDIQHCANVLISKASAAYSVNFPPANSWQCRRIDVTANYCLPSEAMVKEALNLLRNTDAARRKASTPKKGGDTVMWNMGSDRRKGKAYHKGVHLSYLKRHNKTGATDEQIGLANRLLRLELQLGARWFREDLPKMGKQWFQLTTDDLLNEHQNYFNSIIGKDLGADDMTTLIENLKAVQLQIGKTIKQITPAQAAAAYATWMGIQQHGFEQWKATANKATFNRHIRILEAAGLSRADLCAGKLTPVRRRYLVLSQPVWTWQELRFTVQQSANDGAEFFSKVA